LGRLNPGEIVVEVGSGAGLDAILAAQQVGPAGRVIGVDMTERMLDKARQNAALMGLTNLEFRHGYAEELPIVDSVADVVISNGVLNLCPDKLAAWQEIYRVLKPGGRFQIADIVVAREVPESAQRDISLWTG
jgi:arsenite methyltransferase